MTTISIPITKDQERFIKGRVKSGASASVAHAVRQAISLLSEEEAVRAVLDAGREPTLKGKLSELLKQF
jgi:Arc/MetJ-type ribon-helix-helix transcriptional regulator